MKITLTKEEKSYLELMHDKEKGRKVPDRIKAVLLHNEGWSQLDIAQALRIRPETVHKHLTEYKSSQKLKLSSGGSLSFLDESKTSLLIRHLETITYSKVQEICLYVKERWSIEYSVSGMTKWLHQNGFSYKLPKGNSRKKRSSWCRKNFHQKCPC